MKRATQPSLDWGPANQSDRTGRYAINLESCGQEMQEHVSLPRSKLRQSSHNTSPKGNQTETPKEDYYDNEGYRDSYQTESF